MKPARQVDDARRHDDPRAGGGGVQAAVTRGVSANVDAAASPQPVEEPAARPRSPGELAIARLEALVAAADARLRDLEAKLCMPPTDPAERVDHEIRVAALDTALSVTRQLRADTLRRLDHARASLGRESEARYRSDLRTEARPALDRALRLGQEIDAHQAAAARLGAELAAIFASGAVSTFLAGLPVKLPGEISADDIRSPHDVIVLAARERIRREHSEELRQREAEIERDRRAQEGAA